MIDSNGKVLIDNTLNNCDCFCIYFINVRRLETLQIKIRNKVWDITKKFNSSKEQLHMLPTNQHMIVESK